MNNIIMLSDTNPEIDLNSPKEGDTRQLNYFDIITTKLDSLLLGLPAIKEQKQQLTKSFTLEDEDPVSGEVRVYRLSLELIRTLATPLEQVDALELHEQGQDLALESEVFSYEC